MSKQTRGLSHIFYTEWLRPIFHYYVLIEKNERRFEIYTPFLISAFCTAVYSYKGKECLALDALADILPSAISILIGFTAMLITLLLTSSSENIEKLKEYSLDKKLGGKKITLFQGLHIQFSHSLFSEILLIFVVFLYLFLKGLGWEKSVSEFFLLVEVYFVLNILLSILRGVANLYFSFFKPAK